MMKPTLILLVAIKLSADIIDIIIMLGNSAGLQDAMLKVYVEKIFDKYDTDKSGTLDENEMTIFFNDLFKELGLNKQVNVQQSLEAIKSIDKNYDGAVDKSELFLAFKAMLFKAQQQMQSQTNNMPMQGYGGQSGYNYPPPGYYPPPQQGYGGYGGYPQSPFYQNSLPPMYGSQPPMYGSQGPMYGSAPTYGYGNPPNMYGNPNPMYGSQSNQGYNPYAQNNNPYRQF